MVAMVVLLAVVVVAYVRLLVYTVMPVAILLAVPVVSIVAFLAVAPDPAAALAGLAIGGRQCVLRHFSDISVALRGCVRENSCNFRREWHNVFPGDGSGCRNGFHLR